MEQSSGMLPHPNLVSEFQKLKCQVQRREPVNAAAVDIEEEADFVDEVILKVGKQTDSVRQVRCFTENFSPEYLSFLPSDPKFREQISGLVTPEDRVGFAQKYFTGLRTDAEVLSKYQKNAETSRLLRERGSDSYNMGNLKAALHYFNLALMFAEMDSETVGMAYANRSAILVEMGHFEDALEDIDLALKNKYPESRAHRLEKRKVKCEELMQKKREEYLAINPGRRNEIETEIQHMKHMRNELLRVKKPNPLIPAAADCVEIKVDEDQGRHLVVNRDVCAGTVLIEERPYAFTLEGHSKWNTGHCHHCLKRICRGVPCPNCVFAIYCDESCRLEATIHEYECKCMPSFHSIGEVDQVLRAIRIISKVGPEELFRLFETRNPAYFNPKQPFGTEPDCKYESQSYLSIFHLATNSDKLSLEKSAANASHAVLASEVVDGTTNFFEDIPEDCKTEFKKFVAGIVLRHIEAVCVNSVSQRHLRDLEDVTLADTYSGRITPEKLPDLSDPKFEQYAGTLYSVFSLMNHSCDPNVHYLNYPTHGTMIVVATRSLKKGETLSTPYWDGYIENAAPTRQAKLLEHYHFQCRCTACEHQWPSSIELRGQMPTFCCPTCSKTFCYYDKGSPEFRKCILNAPRWECNRCGKLYKESELWFLCDTNMAASMEIHRLLQLVQPRKAFYKCLKLVEYFQNHINPPWVHLYHLQRHIVTSLALILYFAQ